MKNYKKLLSIFTLSLSSGLAQANQVLSGQTVGDELEKSIGLEIVGGRTNAGEACQVSFIPGCGYSILKITTESRSMEISYSMAEEAKKREGDNFSIYGVKPVDAEEGYIILVGDKNYKSISLKKDNESISCQVK